MIRFRIQGLNVLRNRVDQVGANFVTAPVLGRERLARHDPGGRIDGLRSRIVEGSQPVKSPDLSAAVGTVVMVALVGAL